MQEGLGSYTLMASKELIEGLNRACNEMLGQEPMNALASLALPFDIEPVNQHSSKAEFRKEKLAMQKALHGSAQVISLFIGSSGDTDEGMKKVTTIRPL